MPVLVTLKLGGVLSQSELARIARVEQPSMAQLLIRMEHDGVVKRLPDPVDGRSRLVSLTAYPSVQLSDAKAVMDQTCDDALGDLEMEEQKLLLELLLLLKVDTMLNQHVEQSLQANT